MLEIRLAWSGLKTTLPALLGFLCDYRQVMSCLVTLLVAPQGLYN